MAIFWWSTNLITIPIFHKVSFNFLDGLLTAFITTWNTSTILLETFFNSLDSSLYFSLSSISLLPTLYHMEQQTFLLYKKTAGLSALLKLFFSPKNHISWNCHILLLLLTDIYTSSHFHIGRNLLIYFAMYSLYSQIMSLLIVLLCWVCGYLSHRPVKISYVCFLLLTLIAFILMTYFYAVNICDTFLDY